MTGRSAVAPLLLFAASGCLATKSDIQLLQTEARTSRSQSAEGVAAILRADSVRGRQIAQLSATLVRLTDSVRTLTARFAAFQATTNGEFAAMNTQLVQFQALLGQTTRNLQDTRAQIEAMREQGTSAAPPPAGATGDSTQRPPPGTPGQATLYNSANEQLKAGSFRTARNGFDLLLTTYPNSEYASAAMLHVGDAYKGDRNPTAADSVYQLVADRYPKSPDAPTALYRRARILMEANRKDEARVLLNRVIKEYPRSDEAILAKNLLTP
jgi:tol-pal system protein YbgF